MIWAASYSVLFSKEARVAEHSVLQGLPLPFPGVALSPVVVQQQEERHRSPGQSSGETVRLKCVHFLAVRYAQVC